MKKRGTLIDQLLIPVMALLISALLFMAAMMWVNKLTESSTLGVKYLANDLSLLIDSFYLIDGNLIVDYSSYNNVFSKFNIDFSESSVKVSSDNVIETIYFIPDEKVKFIPTKLEKPNKLKIFKLGNYFSATDKEELPESLISLNCPNIKIEEGYDPSSIEYMIPYDEKSEAKAKYSIAVKPVDTAENNIIAYIPKINSLDLAEYNKKYMLACKILNSISKEFDSVNGLSIVPINENMFIIIEVPRVFFENPNLKKALQKGVEDYFK